MKRIAIIGGGAAGLAAAIGAAEAARDMDIDAAIRVFEADDRVGRSILRTGNGRCNFSNKNISATRYNNPEFITPIIFASLLPKRDFYPNTVVEFFEEHGLFYREEDARFYPLANKASVILDVLRKSAEALGVEFCVNSEVLRVEIRENPDSSDGFDSSAKDNSARNSAKGSSRFTLHMKDKRLERADYVIVATGGASSRELLPESFKFIEPAPALCPIATETNYVRRLENIRVRGKLELIRDGKVISREDGEIMFRKFGVSGICVFNLSLRACPGDILRIDFVSNFREVDLVSHLNRRCKAIVRTYGQNMTCGDYLRGIVLPSVADVLLESIGLAPDTRFEKSYTEEIVGALKNFDLRVLGLADVEHAQVHVGGFDVSAFDDKTCEARDFPGLYVVGEALDIVGECGGFNLHWAFSSGLAAGKDAVS